MRVLLVPATYYPKIGGVEEVTRQLARELRRGGDAVAILTNRWQGSGPSGVIDGIDVMRVSLRLPGLLARPGRSVASRSAAEGRRTGPRSVSS